MIMKAELDASGDREKKRIALRTKMLTFLRKCF